MIPAAILWVALVAVIVIGAVWVITETQRIRRDLEKLITAHNNHVVNNAVHVHRTTEGTIT